MASLPGQCACPSHAQVLHTCPPCDVRQLPHVLHSETAHVHGLCKTAHMPQLGMNVAHTSHHWLVFSRTEKALRSFRVFSNTAHLPKPRADVTRVPPAAARHFAPHAPHGVAGGPLLQEPAGMCVRGGGLIGCPVTADTFRAVLTRQAVLQASRQALMAAACPVLMRIVRGERMPVTRLKYKVSQQRATRKSGGQRLPWLPGLSTQHAVCAHHDTNSIKRPSARLPCAGERFNGRHTY